MAAGPLRATLIATGTEVAIAVEAAELLEAMRPAGGGLVGEGEARVAHPDEVVDGLEGGAVGPALVNHGVEPAHDLAPERGQSGLGFGVNPPGRLGGGQAGLDTFQQSGLSGAGEGAGPFRRIVALQTGGQHEGLTGGEFRPDEAGVFRGLHGRVAERTVPFPRGGGEDEGVARLLMTHREGAGVLPEGPVEAGGLQLDDLGGFRFEEHGGGVRGHHEVEGLFLEVKDGVVGVVVAGAEVF